MLRPERGLTTVRRGYPASAEKQEVTLSCEQCRQRKIRCDKSHPCGACHRSRLECHGVRRCRLPRGRTGTNHSKDTDLKNRVAKLENLLADLQSSGDERAAESSRHLRQKAGPPLCAPTVPIEQDQSTNNERVNRSFWATLNDQVAGIRETLEEIPDDESDDPCQSPLPNAVSDSSSQHLDMILFGASCCVVNLPEAPPKSTVIALLDIYIYRVDTVLKVTHVPSLRSLLLSEEQDCPGPFNRISCDALKRAICFTAVCTLTEAESRKMFGEQKENTMNRFRLATEVMLSRANLLTTSDITVLQAFVIYLAGRRTCPGYKKIWTLIASAVRIGQSLGLDNDEEPYRTFFQTEIRRRVWYSIGILDMQAAFDGGSHSVIANNGVLGPPPLNIDDSVLSAAATQPPFPEKSGLTDMSYSSMVHETLICWRRLTHVPTDPQGQPVKVRQEWATRSTIVMDWEHRVHERYLQYCDPSQPFQRFMKFVGQDMIITMRLIERRPMHRLFSAGPPPTDDLNVLELATDVVERSLLKFTEPALTPWAWFSWIKWYALAIMLAELCGHGTGALIDRAWKVAEEAFPILAEVVIDDVLWRCVERLMRKARSRRDAASRGYSFATPAPTFPHATASLEDMDTSRSDGEANQLQGIDWARHADVPSHDGKSRSSHMAEPPAETDRLERQPPPPGGVEPSAPEAIADDSEYMSWVNWELFVQDVGNLNEQDALGASMEGSCD